jgi:hypothetical protein
VELTSAFVLTQAIGTIGLGWLYFRRWRVTRPPIGVFNLADVLVMLGGIVLIPLLYLALPRRLLTGLLALGALSALYFALEPILRSRALLWSVVVLAAAGEWAVLAYVGPTSTAYFVVNNPVLVIGVVGIANLWAQSGMRARDAAILGGALTVNDLIATSYVPLMAQLFERVAALPFAPIVGWTAGPDGSSVGIGLGDLLIATAFPLVMRKAYGRVAGLTGLLVCCVLLVVVFVIGTLGAIAIFPVMALLGPAIVIQYAWWSWRHGAERTTQQYLLMELMRP